MFAPFFQFRQIEQQSIEMCHGLPAETDAEALSAADDIEPLFADDRLRTGPRLTRSEVCLIEVLVILSIVL